jgi:hypothetical protein
MFESFRANPLKSEYLKLILLVALISVGAVIFIVLINLYEKIDWLDFLFYSIVSLLIIAYLSINVYIKRKKLTEMLAVMDELENIPTSSTSSKLSVRQKAGVKADESAASYCPRCKSSFTKTYQFCPNCSYCGIIKKLK